MHVLHINCSSDKGGAARAAFRIHQSLQNQDVGSRFLSRFGSKHSESIEVPTVTAKKITPYIRKVIGKTMKIALRVPEAGHHSLGVIPSSLVNKINQGKWDIVNLHWLGHETLSISNIGKIRHPIVWTVHDMWTFTGSEHYLEKNNGFVNYPKELTWWGGRYLYEKKRKKWKNNISLATPSSWLLDLANKSEISSSWKKRHIFNPIDHEFWNILPDEAARKILGLELATSYILYGAMGGTNDPRKGYDLLEKAHKEIHEQMKGRPYKYITFGGVRKREVNSLGVETISFGHLNDDISLKILYNCADVTVIPSRLDNLPNVAVESLACGVPVAAFNVGGLKDLVIDNVTGYLAENENPSSLAKAVVKCITNKNVETEGRSLRETCRDFALSNLAEDVVGKQYVCFYDEILSHGR